MGGLCFRSLTKIIGGGRDCMSGSVFDNYEKEYAHVISGINEKIDNTRNMSGGANAQAATTLRVIDREVEEAQSLIQQMEMEARSLDGKNKSICQGKIKQYKVEIQQTKAHIQQTKKTVEAQSRTDLMAGSSEGVSNVRVCLVTGECCDSN